MTGAAKACAQSNWVGLQFVRAILRFAADVANGVMQLARALHRHGPRCVPTDALLQGSHRFDQGLP